MKIRAALLLIILTVFFLLVVKPTPALAQSVPEFTLKLVAYPYDIPTTYGIDPYTGKNVTIPGFHVENKSIEITIKNQLFPSNYNLFYNVRFKGHFGESWTEIYSYSRDSSDSLIPQSNSGYTVLSFPTAMFPYGQIDFQVQAVLWHYIEVRGEQHFTLYGPSGWNNSQTITIPTILPNVTLLLPQNGIFSTSDVPLYFAVDQSASETKYSLDGKENVTVAGNTTLTELTNGSHNVTVYATDEAGNTGASETINFTVAVPEPFPIMLVIASTVIVAIVVGLGLLVYLKKRQKVRIHE